MNKSPFNLSTKLPQRPLYQSIHTSRSIGNMHLSSTELQKKFEELYQNKKWKAKMDKLRDERNKARSLEQTKECTFVPKINPEMVFDGSGRSSFLKREQDWASKKQRKIEELKRQTQKRQKQQLTFHPKISQKSYMILHTPTKYLPRQQPTYQSVTHNKSSYRLMYQKRSAYQQLQKQRSQHQFTLMTSRLHTQRHSPCLDFNSSQRRLNFNSSELKFIRQPQSEDYIQNIVIKAEEQDTFNSLSSMQLKTERKDIYDHDSPVMSKEIKIFEQGAAQYDENQIEQRNQENEDTQNENI